MEKNGFGDISGDYFYFYVLEKAKLLCGRKESIFHILATQGNTLPYQIFMITRRFVRAQARNACDEG